MKLSVKQLRSIIKEEVEEAVGGGGGSRGANMQNLRDFFAHSVVDQLTDLDYSRGGRKHVLYLGNDFGGDALYDALDGADLIPELESIMGVEVLPFSKSPAAGMGEEL